MSSQTRVLRENTTSKVHINTGPRGAGKTLLMVRMICLALIICEWINNLYKDYIGTRLLEKPLRVWSNLPITIRYVPSQDGALWPGANRPKKLSTLPLNMHKLMAFDKEMKWGFVFVDELDQHADRQDWMNGGQKLFMKILIQIRKLHLSLTATIQSLNWVNPRLMFQLDTATACRDAAVTAWGQANDLEPGTLTFTYSRDISGRETGYTFEESGEIYQGQLFGLPLHNLYITDTLLNPWESFESVKVKRKQYVLDPNEQNEVARYEDDLQIIEGALTELLDKGVQKIKRADFFNIAQDRGMVMNKAEALSFMEDVHGVRAYGSMGIKHLDLSGAKNIASHRVEKAAKGKKPRKAEEPPEKINGMSAQEIGELAQSIAESGKAGIEKMQQGGL